MAFDADTDGLSTNGNGLNVREEMMMVETRASFLLRPTNNVNILIWISLSLSWCFKCHVNILKSSKKREMETKTMYLHNNLIKEQVDISILGLTDIHSTQFPY